MLSAPLSADDILTGEILWAGSKGFFFSFAVIVVVASFGLVPLPWSFLTPFVGFITGLMFASLSMFTTSFVTTINHFNFYFTGLLSPMFFFSGVIFPLKNLPISIRWFAEILPLTHSVRIMRSLDFGLFEPVMLLDFFYIALFICITGWWGIKRLKKRLIR